MWTYWCIGKKTAFKAFTESTPAELTALSQLGVVEMPSADVVLGCESFFFFFFFCAGSLAQKLPTRQHSWKIEVEALSEPTWGGHWIARGGIRVVHGLTKSTLITYFSGVKKDPKYAFLHAFFLICLSCSFQNLSIWPKTHPFFQFCTVLHP